MMIKDKFRTILKLWSTVCTLSISFMFYVTFLLIFFSEGKITYVAVNEYGEGLIELVVISLALSFALVGFGLLMVDKAILKSSRYLE